MCGTSQGQYEKGSDIPNPYSGFVIGNKDGDVNTSYYWVVWSYLGNTDDEGKPISEPIYLVWASITIPKEEIEAALNNN